MLKYCPACKAKHKGKIRCYRCGLNLAKLDSILDQANTHLLQARIAYLKNDFPQMLFHARRASSLHRNTETAKILACATLLSQKFDKAVGCWQEIDNKARGIE